MLSYLYHESNLTIIRYIRWYSDLTTIRLTYQIKKTIL